MRRTFLAAAILTALSGPAIPVAAQTPTIDQSLSLKSATNPRISPDGRWVAYQVRETNWEENAFENQIWIADANTGERYQLTRAKKSSTSPAWSPDGQWLAFVSDRPMPGAGAADGKRQLYLIQPRGGEARALTKSETGVSAFEWAPDGKHIAFTAADPESKARKDRKEKYGEFEVVQNDYTFTHLWLLEVNEDTAKTPEPKRLSEGTQFTVGGFSWAPDSARIAFSAARDADLGSSDTSDIYVLRLADTSVKRIVDTQGPDTNPVWSPDGTQIAYQTANARKFYYYTNSLIAVVPAEGGTPRLLTESFDEQPGLIAWGPDGIYFGALQKTYSHLFHLDPASRAITRVSSPEKAIFGGFSFSKDFKQAAFSSAGPASYPEVYSSSLASFAPKRLTAMGEQFRGLKLATRELIEWKSTDGTPIEGVLLKPADFDPSKKYPLLVAIHGGPTDVARAVLSADSYYPLEIFCAKGALILRPNYRGSAGYGEKFRTLNVRNLGVGDAWDVLSGVDALIARGIVDPDRVGSMGWSQGGYISAFLTTSSNRFKAISVGAGISDWSTYYVNTDIHPFTRQYLKATPWDDPEIYAKTSPITYVKNAKTPTLIQHGELDRRVPIPNAYELRQALEDRGVPVKMVVYKGFGHGIDKPRQQRAVMEHNLEWFSQYIWGEKMATPGAMALLNGHFWTGNPDHPWAEAVVIEGNKITRVGSTEAIGKETPAGAQVVDLGGRFAMPGFNDAHIHFLSGSMVLSQADLNDAGSLEEMQRRLVRYAQEHPGLPWIQGSGWQYSDLPGKRLPTRADIDAVIRDRPVYLRSYDGHTGWVNSKALEIAGVTEATKFEGFGELVRDATGVPSGVLKEGARTLVLSKIPQPSREQELDALRAGIRLALSLGITSIQNAHGSEHDVRLYQELLDRGELPIRVGVAMDATPKFSQADMDRVAALAREFNGPHLRVGAIKMVMDGVIETHTAAMLAPYADLPGSPGSPQFTQEQANHIVAMADRAGVQVYIHAIGDRAVRMSLDAYENARKVNGVRDSRFRIEHIETVSPQDIPRFAKLGVLAAMQPIHADAATIDVWANAAGPERTSRAFAWRLLEKNGATLVSGSDWPACISISPFRGLHTAVNRQTTDGKPAGGWLPQHRVSLETALTAYTRNGAYASFSEKTKGTIAPGMLADIIVLSANPFEIRPADLHTLRVEKTIVDGKVVYEK